MPTETPQCMKEKTLLLQDGAPSLATSVIEHFRCDQHAGAFDAVPAIEVFREPALQRRLAMVLASRFHRHAWRQKLRAKSTPSWDRKRCRPHAREKLGNNKITRRRRNYQAPRGTRSRSQSANSQSHAVPFVTPPNTPLKFQGSEKRLGL